MSGSIPFYVMSRHGSISLKKDSTNQCKSVGHRHFQYQLRMVFDGKMTLDARQYILDHQDVDDIIQKTGFLGSCEQIHQVLMINVMKLMTKKKIPMLAARCILRPTTFSYNQYILDQSAKAWLEYIHVIPGYTHLLPLLMG